MKELSYPFDSATLLKNRKKIKKTLINDGSFRIKKRIAVLGGSTTNDIVSMLELFLLEQGIEPEFYQSEYGKYWEDVMFSADELVSFRPDLIYIHTTSRNITEYNLNMKIQKQEMEQLFINQFEHFKAMWKRISETFNCPIIQNNFELPYYRILGNRDAWDYHGMVNFVSRLNIMFYDYAQFHDDFFINDINYLSSYCGLEKWSDPSYWYMYKYAVNLKFIPDLAFNISNIIKSIFGKNKKALVLDLDNTLWGGVIGDDGADGIDIGRETASAEAFYDFQNYVKQQQKIGVMLGICSKNDYENAIEGLNHPDGVLTPDDFINIKANWEPKNINIENIAKEINILPESIVFADDNPAEREIVHEQLNIQTPKLESPEDYIRVIDRSGFFEVTALSEDDIKRNEMYKANSKRMAVSRRFDNYDDYLRSLDMIAEIEDFKSIDLQRITQLTNKSNQFNLTTKRYTLSEMEKIFEDNNYIRLCGRLKDKFGDNGIVSVIIGRKDNDILHIELWLMSCRVLKRNMEYAMFDCLIEESRRQGIKKIYGHYLKTKKNSMVKNLLYDFGFELVNKDEDENTDWEIITDKYINKNKIIKVKKTQTV